jgi:hypothetical protein
MGEMGSVAHLASRRRFAEGIGRWKDGDRRASTASRGPHPGARRLAPVPLPKPPGRGTRPRAPSRLRRTRRLRRGRRWRLRRACRARDSSRVQSRHARTSAHSRRTRVGADLRVTCVSARRRRAQRARVTRGMSTHTAGPPPVGGTTASDASSCPATRQGGRTRGSPPHRQRPRLPLPRCRRGEHRGRLGTRGGPSPRGFWGRDRREPASARVGASPRARRTTRGRPPRGGPAPFLPIDSRRSCRAYWSRRVQTTTAPQPRVPARANSAGMLEGPEYTSIPSTSRTFR